MSDLRDLATPLGRKVWGSIGAVAVLTLILGLPDSSAAPDDKHTSDTTIFSTPVGKDGQTLVVVRGPDRDVSVLKGIVADGFLEQVGSLYEIRAELHVPNQPPLALASRLYSENKLSGESARGVAVLGHLVDSGGVVLAMGEGTDLLLWRFGIPVPRHIYLSPLGQWSACAAPYRLDAESVSVRLGRTPDGGLMVHVEEKIASPHQHTVYEQLQNAPCDFRMIHQWQDQSELLRV